MSRGSMWGRFDRYSRKTFGQAAAKYLRDAEDIRGVKNPGNLARCVYHLSLYIANKPIIEIDEKAIRKFKEDRFEGKGKFSRPASAGTVNKDLRTLRAVLNYACRVERWIPAVPLIRDVKGPVKVAHPLSLVEKNRVFGALPEHWRNGAAKFALYTGVRKSELTSLRWEYMQPFDGRYIFILPETKNGKQRAVICNSKATEAVEYMRRWQAENKPNSLVFPSRLTGGEMKNVLGVWRIAWRDAGMPDGAGVLKGWNTLRHTYATWLMAAGVADELRDKLMGHHSSDIRYNYSQPALERLFEASELVTDDKLIGGATILKAVPLAN